MHIRERITLIVALALLITSAGIGTASATTRYNAATIYVQEQSLWCWAATSKTVIKWHTGSTPSQCQVVKWGKSSSTCPNTTGYFGVDVSRALTQGGVGGIGYTTSTMSFTAVRSEIDMNRLVLIRWGWDSGSGHMLVLRGYNTTGSAFSYIDPMKSVYQSASRAWILDRGSGTSHHVWTHSRYDMVA